MLEQTDYVKYRGKCKEFVDELIASDNTLTAVRGHYYCPIWNSDEPHWWAVKPDGTIVDPTVKQFPSGGIGTYVPFDGTCKCSQCGKAFQEDDEKAIFESNYTICSYECYGRFVGII